MTRSAMIVPPLDNRKVRSEHNVEGSHLTHFQLGEFKTTSNAQLGGSATIEAEKVNELFATYMHARPPPWKVILVPLA